MKKKLLPRFYVLEEAFGEEAFGEETFPVIEAEEYFQALHAGIDLFEEQEKDEFWYTCFEAHLSARGQPLSRLPRIRCEACGRETWLMHMHIALPFDLPPAAPLWRFIGRTGNPVYVSWQEWDVFSQGLCEEIQRVGRRVPLFGPNCRLGTVHLSIRYRRVKDFFQLPGVGGTFVSERLREVLQDGGISGYDLYPAPVDEAIPLPSRVPVPPLPCYYELVVVGRGRLDIARSRYTAVHQCQVCARWIKRGDKASWDGIYVDPEQWDGADLLRVEEAPHYILVTEQVKEALEKFHIIGYRTVPADTQCFPEFRRA